MRSGIIFSAIIHILLVVVLLFGLPSYFEKKITEESAVIVEILPVADITNVKPRRKVVPKSKPKRKPSSSAKIKPALPDPTKKPKPKMSKPEPKPKKAPKIAKKPKPEPKIVQKDVKPIVRPPKKEEKKVEEKKEEEKPEDLFASVLNTVEEIETSQKDEKETEEDNLDFSDIEDMLASSNDQPKYMPGLPLSISEKDAIINQIMRNWNTSSFSGAKDAHKMIVTLIVIFNKDGTVEKITRKNTTRYHSDRVYRSMVESAERAVRKSSPLKDLPPEKYAVKDGWREMKINFDPSQMMY